MTIAQLATSIGKPATLKVEGGAFTVPVKIVDARIVFSRVDFLVEGVNGVGGSKWVDRARIELVA